ncbi:MAG: hypothetical protein EHM58_04510 [Ignavibacteriae bacterium]|nr:MAG: hypothetical protein EHM58_04510 [Ignavibacteriota bacterium]
MDSIDLSNLTLSNRAVQLISRLIDAKEAEKYWATEFEKTQTETAKDQTIFWHKEIETIQKTLEEIQNKIQVEGKSVLEFIRESIKHIWQILEIIKGFVN